MFKHELESRRRMVDQMDASLEALLRSRPPVAPSPPPSTVAPDVLDIALEVLTSKAMGLGKREAQALLARVTIATDDPGKLVAEALRLRGRG